jgi:integrase
MRPEVAQQKPFTYVAERERHLRIVAGVPDGANVDLSLVKLPPEALMFPGSGFTKPRHPNAVSKEFKRNATALGFPGLRFHDLRGTHETLLLDSAAPGLLGDGLSVIGLSSGNSNRVGLVIGTFIFFSSC